MKPYYKDKSGEIYLGDTLTVLKSLETGIVQCVITSPPYWGLRDYKVDGQYGLEKTPEEYIENMVKVFREVKRVMRDDATLWLNMGDCYSGGGSGMQNGNTLASPLKKNGQWGHIKNTRNPIDIGLKPKDLCGIPWRLALALQADGWYLRSDIIWHKPNPLPESVTDRPTKSHEYIFLMSKKANYFYDADAVRENYSDSYRNDNRHKTGSTDKNIKNGYNDALAQNPKQIHRLFNKPLGNGRNLRDVWTIPTQSCSFAHFATFPTALVDKCLMAGTAEKTCAVCGWGWERIVEPTEEYKKLLGTWTKDTDKDKTLRKQIGFAANTKSVAVTAQYKTIGFRPACDCNGGVGRSIVLDPFGGTGTVALRAKELGRRFIHIDLSEKYNEYAKRRLVQEELF